MFKQIILQRKIQLDGDEDESGKTLQRSISQSQQRPSSLKQQKAEFQRGKSTNVKSGADQRASQIKQDSNLRNQSFISRSSAKTQFRKNRSSSSENSEFLKHPHSKTAFEKQSDVNLQQQKHLEVVNNFRKNLFPNFKDVEQKLRPREKNIFLSKSELQASILDKDGKFEKE